MAASAPEAGEAGQVEVLIISGARPPPRPRHLVGVDPHLHGKADAVPRPGTGLAPAMRTNAASRHNRAHS